MTQFLRDQASDSEEVVRPLMLDGTYLSRNSRSWIQRSSHSVISEFLNDGFNLQDRELVIMMNFPKDKTFYFLMAFFSYRPGQ